MAIKESDMKNCCFGPGESARDLLLNMKPLTKNVKYRLGGKTLLFEITDGNGNVIDSRLFTIGFEKGRTVIVEEPPAEIMKGE